MAWSYSASSTSTLNKLRRRIGDTNTNEQLLDDDELNEFLAEFNSDIYLAGASACWAIVAKLAREVDHSSQGNSASRNQKVQAYKDLAKELRAYALASGCTMSVGGVSVSEEITIESDTDFKQPRIKTGGDDYPGSGGSSGNSNNV